MTEAGTRWLVTGSAGMLGTDLMATLGGRPHVTGLDLPDLDITDAAAVEKAVAGHDIVVNCAAWTDVDGAEDNEAAAFAVNALGSLHLAQACRQAGARLVQVSTDFVFARPGRQLPYAEADLTGPGSAYGRTKAAGEWAVRATLRQHSYLVRTAWLYGENGRCFPKAMLRLERTQPFVDVVDDQHGQPTWSRDVAERIVAMVEAEAPPGVYHAVSSGQTTWYEYARAVFTAAGQDPDRIRPIRSEELARRAPRPSYTVLAQDRWETAGLPPLRHWRDAFAEAFPLVVRRLDDELAAAPRGM